MIYDFSIDMNDLNNTATQAILAVQNNSRVLEVGCATGYVGEKLAQKGCQVVGIEYIPEMAEAARNRNCYQQVLNLDLNQLALLSNLNIEPVDHIILTDVIEHILYPREVIAHLQMYLSNQGTMIFSIPNISHGSIKLSLLLNQFNYTPMGLLDATHIKFFTLKSIESMMTEQNLEILRIARSWAGLSTWDQPIDLGLFPESILEFIRADLESYAYQYFVEVQKSTLSPTSLKLQNTTFLKPSKEDYVSCRQYCKAFL